MIDVIQTQEALNARCGEATQMPWVGFDTEFERIRTYYPKLCLIQMSTPDVTVCVDPLAELDFSPLYAVLSNPGVIKIFHAARQDLEVLHTAFGISISPIFDTQIAAQLCGYRQQIAYAELAKNVCEVDLPKQYTRTDWSRRPLSRAEVKYALDDARYLGAIYLNLKRRLDRLGRSAWAREDCEWLTSPAILASASAGAIRKIQSGARGLPRVEQSVAYQLALWREGAAQSRNRPREWILNSKALFAIAARLPTNAADLKNILELSVSGRSRWRSAILSSVKVGTKRAVEYQPLAAPARPSLEEKRKERLLWERLKVVCEAGNIPMGAVAPREDVRKLARGDCEIRLMKGWRRQFAGQDLFELAAHEERGYTC